MATIPPDVQKRETAPSTDAGRGAKTTPDEAPAAPPTVKLDRANPEFLAGAHAVYSGLRAQGPVVRASFGTNFTDGARAAGSPERQTQGASEHAWLFVTRYDEAVEALLDERFSSDFRTGMTPEQQERAAAALPEEFQPIAHSLLMLDPPDHTRLRKLVQPNFTARAMDALKPRIQRLVDELLDKAERAAAERGETSPERRMEFVEAFAYPLPVQVISDLLGIPVEDQPQVHVWAERFLQADPQQYMANHEARAGMMAFTRYLEGLFERKRREPTEDMISQMVHAQEDGDRLNPRELLSMVFILFLAGHITTVNLLGNGVVALLTHPEQHARFLADPAGMAKGMVEETLRYWGPVDFLGSPRTVKEDSALGGVHIPKGSKLTVGLASANRDPHRFENPDAYDISRPDAHRNIAFGKGIHVCIGAPLARLEAQIAFETLFRRFPKLRLAVSADSLRLGVGAAMRGFKHIPVLY
ncbi:cytochrome P450 family protein [Cystobacter ferrugineus]|uniref:Cytochrome hydroxylase n=1 Tax=Cystobacter ferrugineus TaxID=83449 RepID=A0A1L9BKZ4_9BACT|nr:cytochrome P450 [Cystobacter ferrugineus]OJH42875.1 cytochrome hydroxylase [Cystobacter ferrugineus]